MQQFIGLFFSIFLLLVGHVTPAYAADTPPPEETVSQDSFDDYKELADTKLDAAKESLQKDIQNFTTRVEGQDKRIDQLGSEIDRSLTLLGVLLVLAGVISFFSFRSAARKQALDEVKAWFTEHEQSLSDRKQALTNEMDGFKQQITELQEQVHDQAKTIQEVMRELEEKLIAESDELVKKISASRQVHDSLKTDMPQLSQSESVLLAKAADKTQHKPEAERTFADWNRLAFAAYKNNAKEIAISEWQKATTALDVDDRKIAQSLFNIGTTWRELGEYQKAIGVYDSLLQRFTNSDVLGVQEQCANALFSKGVTLGEKLNDPQGAVEVYDSLLQRFGDSTIPGVQKQCARALVNKGMTLGGRLNDPRGEVSAYDALLQHFAASLVPSVQEQCAIALVNKGVTLVQKFNNPKGAVAAYDELLQRFGDSTVLGLEKQCAKALIGKGITLGRMGDLAGVVACYDELFARYSQSGNPAIRKLCTSAEANMGEFLLVSGGNTEAIPKIRQVLERVDTTDQEFAIMHFLLWLAGTDSPVSIVLTAIRALSSEVQFTWGGDDIRPLVDKLPEPRKTQAECFITFFEKHHDIAMLERCLAAASN